MGNHNSRDGRDATVPALDFFHTAPTTPSEAALSAMALSSASSSDEPQTPPPAGSTTPPSTSHIANWTQNLSTPLEWAVINVDRVTQSDAKESKEARLRRAAVSPMSLPPSGASPSEGSWQERDSGLEPQAAEERAGEEMTLVLVSLMEHYGASLGLTPNADVTTGAVELLRQLITQKDELTKEVDALREMLQKERLEWQQFQCDLQVAVSVADRLRGEAEQALGLLQRSNKAMEEQLAQALSRQQQQDRELESLREEHKDTCRKLNELTQEQQEQEEQQEPDPRRDTLGLKETADCDQHFKEEKEDEEKTSPEAEAKHVEKQKENETHQEVRHDDMVQDPKEAIESESSWLGGPSVAEGYLHSLASPEKKKEGQRDPRRVAELSERSWSLSRLVLPTEPSAEDRPSKKTSATLPLCKKEEPRKQRRVDRLLQRQDSWCSFYAGKRDEARSSDGIKPQSGFGSLLRRHGGSRRNSLLRWCQSRTRGYKNIEITNFSSSWEDGLAFCALYHTYVPTLIPYDALNPENKMQNLNLAFKTGARVGIAATLTTEEMLKAEGPDWQRVLGYVESIFRHFET